MSHKLFLKLLAQAVVLYMSNKEVMEDFFGPLHGLGPCLTTLSTLLIVSFGNLFKTDEIYENDHILRL